jgi:hypothetical protein
VSRHQVCCGAWRGAACLPCESGGLSSWFPVLVLGDGDTLSLRPLSLLVLHITLAGLRVRGLSVLVEVGS